MSRCTQADGNAVSFFMVPPIRSLLLAGALCCLPPWAAAAEALSEWHPFVEARAWAAYDAFPIADLDGDWSRGFSPKGDRNVMLHRNRAEIGVEKGAWRIGWEYREDATVVADRQTLEFIRRYKQRAKPATATTDDLAGRFDSFSAQGPRLGRWFGAAANGWMPRVHLSGAIYTSAALREGDASGTVHYAPVDQYDFNVRRTDANSKYRYPFMQHEPSASGASISMVLAWRLSKAVSVDANIDDLWSAMRWRNLPVKDDRIDSRVTEYDAQGYVNYRPLLSGTNRQVARNGALARSGGATLTVDLGPVAVGAGVERLAGVTIPSVALAHQFGWGKLSTRIETRFRTIGVGIDTERFHLALQTDSLRLGQAKALGMSVGMRY
ncbi:MAG: hypothetical protein M3R60_01830 [Pseudomonadota bacterium]|nr:hypothetical protein [Pseudomonadota bacterium]